MKGYIYRITIPEIDYHFLGVAKNNLKDIYSMYLTDIQMLPNISTEQINLLKSIDLKLALKFQILEILECRNDCRNDCSNTTKYFSTVLKSYRDLNSLDLCEKFIMELKKYSYLPMGISFSFDNMGDMSKFFEIEVEEHQKEIFEQAIKTLFDVYDHNNKIHISVLFSAKTQKNYFYSYQDFESEMKKQYVRVKPPNNFVATLEYRTLLSNVLTKEQAGIYQILCTVNNKSYIGRTQNIRNRIGQHYTLLSSNTHHSFKLQRDYNKFGRDAFEEYFLYPINTPQIEEKFIELFNSRINGFNIA